MFLSVASESRQPGVLVRMQWTKTNVPIYFSMTMNELINIIIRSKKPHTYFFSSHMFMKRPKGDEKEREEDL